MKVMSILKYLMLSLGFFMLLAAFFSYQTSKSFLLKSGVADGVVVGLVQQESTSRFLNFNAELKASNYYYPEIEFTTMRGLPVRFVGESGSNPSSYSVGDRVGVLYIKYLPKEAKINSFMSLWGVAIACLFSGLLFAAIGSVMFVVRAIEKRKIQYLRQNGVPVSATYQGVEQNILVSSNNSNPYRVCGEWTDPKTSRVHVFKSEDIWFDPTEHMTVKELTVLVDKANPDKYHVEISFLSEFGDVGVSAPKRSRRKVS